MYEQVIPVWDVHNDPGSAFNLAPKNLSKIHQEEEETGKRTVGSVSGVGIHEIKVKWFYQGDDGRGKL